MLAHVAFFLPTLEGGGAERSFVELANRFASQGVRVDFIVADCRGPYVSEVSGDVRLIDLGTRRKLRALLALTRYLRRERPPALMAGLDVANAGAVAATILAGGTTRCVLSQQSMMRATWQIDRPSSWRLWLWMLRKAYTRADLVIANSHAACLEMANEIGVARRKCVVIHNGIEAQHIDRLSRQHVADAWLANDALPLIVSVGRLAAVKDVPTLLRAFAIVLRSRACNLLILGEGAERAPLRALASDLGIECRVRMPGFIPNPFPWIAGARVLVSASLIEGCPNVIQQALACGTPVVAADSLGGTAEVLDNGRWGRMVPVGDAEAMAAAIVATLDDPRPVDGRERAAQFDPRVAAQKYLDYLLPNRSCAAP